MKLSHRKLTIAMTLLTAFVLCASLAFVGPCGLAQKSTTNPDGSTTKSEPDNTYGAGGTKETTTTKDGVTREVQKDKDGLPLKASETSKKKDHEIEITWGYDKLKRQTHVLKIVNGDKYIVRWEYKELTDKDKKEGKGPDLEGKARGEFYDTNIEEWLPNKRSIGIVESNLKRFGLVLFPKILRQESKIPKESGQSAESTSAQGYKVENTTSPGVNTQIITTPNGKLIVNVPNELYATDTFTGTVVTEPAGKSEAERARNQDQLNGMVLDIGQQKTSVAEKIFTRTIPSNLTREAQSLSLMVKGETVVNAPIPISGAAPPPPLENLQLPTGGQMGRNIVVHALCNGVADPTDTVKVSGQELPLIAESPRMRVVKNTSNVAGPTEIELNEQGKVTKGPFRNIGVKVYAPKTNLLKGENEPLEVTCSGMQRIQQDVPLDVVTTGVVNMSGGNTQHFDIHPSDVRADGTYPRNFTITAQEAGTFSVTATVTWTSTSLSGGPLAGRPTRPLLGGRFPEGTHLCSGECKTTTDEKKDPVEIWCLTTTCPAPCSCKLFRIKKDATGADDKDSDLELVPIPKFPLKPTKDKAYNYYCYCVQ